MKEWHFQGIKTYSDPSYIFSGSQDPLNPQDLRPWSDVWRLSVWRLSDVCLSRTSGLSREQRGLWRLKLAEVAHVTRDSDTAFKVKRSKVKVIGGGSILWRPPTQLICLKRKSGSVFRKISWKSGWPRKVKRPAGRSVKKQLVRVEQLISQWVAVESVIQ